MNKLKAIIRILLSSRYVVITATGIEEHPWILTGVIDEDDEVEDILHSLWMDV